MTHFLLPKIGSDGKFSLEVNPGVLTGESFAEASVRVARELSDSYGSSLYLSYSGGLDSDYVLQTFVANRLAITPVVLVTGLNAEESQRALSNCRALSVEPLVLTLTPKNFLLQIYKLSVRHNFDVLLGLVPALVREHLPPGVKLITGSGDPTPDVGKATSAFIPEWCYYLDIITVESNNFFSQDASLFSAFLSEANRSLPSQESKARLYGMPEAKKIRYDPPVYEFQRAIKRLDITVKSIQVDIDALLEKLSSSSRGPFTLIGNQIHDLAK